MESPRKKSLPDQRQSARDVPRAADPAALIAHMLPNILRGVHVDFGAAKGVTQTQFLVLAAIHSFGRCPMTELARALRVSLPTVTGIIERLVRSGNVRRRQNENDRRRVMVELTGQGGRVIDNFLKAVRRRWTEIFNSLPARDVKMIHQGLRKLADHVRRRIP